MNEQERLLKLQNAVKMMVADQKSPEYIDKFLAAQNSSPEEIKAINEYGVQNIAKARQSVQQKREELPSNSLLANMLKPEALEAGIGSAQYGGERILDAATAGGYGWANKKLGGDFAQRQEEYQQLLKESPRWLRNVGRAGLGATSVAGALQSPIYALNVAKGADIASRIANIGAQAGIYGGLKKGFEEDSIRNVPSAALQEGLIGAGLAGLLIGIPSGFAKAGGISSGAGAETTGLAQKAGREGGSAARAFRAGRKATELDIAQDLDEAYNAVDRQAKQAFGAGKKAIEAQPINKSTLVQSFKDWKKANFVPYGRKNLATPEEQKVFNQANRMLKKFANRKGDMILGEGHALKNAIGNISAERGSAAERVRTQLYNIVGKHLNTEVPQYSALMKPYAEAKDTLLAIKQATGEAGRSMTDVQMAGVTRRLVNSMKSPATRNVIEKVMGPDFTSKVAGYATKSWVPETSVSRLGAAGLMASGIAGAPSVLSALPFLSPRIMGNAAFNIGRLQSVAPSTENILRSVRQLY